jgi:hypothetical protein
MPIPYYKERRTRARGLRCSEPLACSMAMSGAPAQILRTPLRSQPRASGKARGRAAGRDQTDRRWRGGLGISQGAMIRRRRREQGDAYTSNVSTGSWRRMSCSSATPARAWSGGMIAASPPTSPIRGGARTGLRSAATIASRRNLGPPVRTNSARLLGQQRLLYKTSVSGAVVNLRWRRG